MGDNRNCHIGLREVHQLWGYNPKKDPRKRLLRNAFENCVGNFKLYQGGGGWIPAVLTR
jgi:hypothetical protein